MTELTVDYDLTPTMWAEVVGRTDSASIRRGSVLFILLGLMMAFFASAVGLPGLLRDSVGWLLLAVIVLSIGGGVAVFIKAPALAVNKAMGRYLMDWFPTSGVSMIGWGFIRRLEEAGVTTRVRVILNEDGVAMLRKLSDDDDVVLSTGGWRAVPHIRHTRRMTILHGGGWFNALSRTTDDPLMPNRRASGVATSILLPTDRLPAGFDEWVTEQVNSTPVGAFPEVLRVEDVDLEDLDESIDIMGFPGTTEDPRTPSHDDVPTDRDPSTPSWWSETPH